MTCVIISGFVLDNEEIDKSFKEFKSLLDKKKEVFDTDIIAIVRNETTLLNEIIKLKNYSIQSGNTITSSAIIKLEIDNEILESVEIGDGPVDAAFKAIQRITGISFNLKDYNVNSVSRGKDAQGEVSIKVEKGNVEYTGRGLSTDIVKASILAYISVSNKIINDSVVYNLMKDYIDDMSKNIIENIS